MKHGRPSCNASYCVSFVVKFGSMLARLILKKLERNGSYMSILKWSKFDVLDVPLKRWSSLSILSKVCIVLSLLHVLR